MRLAYLFAFVPMIASAQVQQGAPNADFRPAFTDQTRAPALSTSRVQVSVFASGLDEPWGIATLPGGQFLVTERRGTLRVVNADGGVSAPLQGVPNVADRGQGGLLDVAVARDFAASRTIYLTYAKPVRGGAVTAAAKAQLTPEGRLINVTDIFVQTPASNGGRHFGSRIIPMSDGSVFVTTGDRGRPQMAQDSDATIGKIIRIGADGTTQMWSTGHRNIQGAALDAGGTLWTIEHGPRGGDELNQPQPGRNYGWPIISYGINYSGSDVGSGIAVRDGLEQPVYYWDPVIAPAGMTFYYGPYADWRGDLFVGSLNPGALVRLKMQGGRVVGEERLITAAGRIRDVEADADGSLLVLTPDQILRVTPG